MTIFLTTLLLLIPLPLLLLLLRISPTSSTSKSNRIPLPPGSLGIPILGQSLALLRSMRANTAEKWIEDRIRKYGPISKLSLFGRPTVFVYGQAANKVIFGNDGGGALGHQPPQSLKMILGERNMSELSGSDHKRVRKALVSFLKPESLKRYVGKMDAEVRKHIEMHWEGKEKVSVMIKGVWSVPLNLPFTPLNRSLRESARMQSMVKELLLKKKIELEQNGASPHQDLVTYLLSMHHLKDDEEKMMTEEEIVHNVIAIMFAGHDNISVLLTFIIRLLATEPSVYASVLQEQEEIAKGKHAGEPLSWEDLVKMKYTWRVALETLRIVPPIFGGFRKTLKDIEYEGYLIPKGWQIFWVSAMTHMDSSIFPEPSKFDPSRFENQASIPPYCFVSFGGGPRICPGIEFAKYETLVAIHYLVTKFNWKLCADNTFTRDFMPTPNQGLPLQISPRVLS
ncbi:taxadiene 5-alpha hydroxylase-like [Senna tora]|uniref:Taxadiene 5-alpha hydroxylase-like n=1 Tax=Senna tora TaxID=362788 RepID=A0A834WC88_9FABA|nr:taxadiene 5-alpha hydroxylase-like [Senna tora]